MKIFLVQGFWQKIITNNMKTQITIIGFGIMGKAIAQSLLSYNSIIKIFIVDRNNSNFDITQKNIEKSDFIILAVKPQDAKEAIQKFKFYFKKHTILISIMAGVSIKKIAFLSGHKKILRMMPNLGLTIGEGIAAWKGSGLSKVEIKKSKDLINKITDNFEVKNEDEINKITAISGSGPAYFFLLADSLIKVCESFGFTKAESLKLVEKTFSASAILGKEDNYSALIKKVASKKGTTEAALKVFKKENFNKIILKAVHAAYKRANEINNE